MHHFTKGGFIQGRTLVLTVFVGALLLGWTTMGGVTFAQTPRPTLTFTPTPVVTVQPNPTPQPEPQTQAPAAYTGPILRGRVINLSTDQPEGGVPVVFATGGISVEVVSDENGEYAFEHLGTANGLLNVVPARQSGLVPVAADVAVQPKTGVETVVNLGVSLGSGVAPPLIPTVELSSGYVSAGDILTITVLVENTLQQAISGATITDWLPERVLPVSINASTGHPYFSDNLAIVELGNLEAGSGALVEIVVQVSSGQMSSSVLQGKPSFFYRENVAAQATGGSNGAAPTVLPVTGLGLPLIGLGLILIVVIVGWVRRRMNRISPAH